jgi:hypothetical protein
VGSYLPLITGSGGALVTLALGLWMFVSGKIHPQSEMHSMESERDYWRDAYMKVSQAITIERRIATETAEAGQVTNQLIQALAEIAATRSGSTPPPRRRAAKELAAEDLGL